MMASIQTKRSTYPIAWQVVVKPSGDNPGGFVVYRQTVELVEMLNKQVVSVLG